MADDRASLGPGDRAVLVIDDDPAFAKLLRDLARERGLKALVATHGDTGLALAREHRPMGIPLDLMLHGMSGWWVLNHL